MSDIVKQELPTLQELVLDIGNYKKSDKLNFLLGQKVPNNWIKYHPYIKIKNEKGQYVPYPYLPIDKVEYLLRKIFKRVRIEILRENTAFNGVVVTTRVHYWNMLFNEWDFHDGIGAINLQTKAGKSPADLSNINNGALSIAFPLAKTLAIKDACDHFGEIFGANLNRKDILAASMDAPTSNNEDDFKEIVKLMEDENIVLPDIERMNIERIIELQEVSSYKKALKVLKNT